MTEALAPDLFALLRDVQRSETAARSVTADTAKADAKNFLCMLRNTLTDDPEPTKSISRAWLTLCKRAGYDLDKEEEQSSYALTCAAHYVASSWRRHAIDCRVCNKNMEDMMSMLCSIAVESQLSQKLVLEDAETATVDWHQTLAQVASKSLDTRFTCYVCYEQQNRQQAQKAQQQQQQKPQEQEATAAAVEDDGEATEPSTPQAFLDESDDQQAPKHAWEQTAHASTDTSALRDFEESQPEEHHRRFSNLRRSRHDPFVISTSAATKKKQQKRTQTQQDKQEQVRTTATEPEPDVAPQTTTAAQEEPEKEAPAATQTPAKKRRRRRKSEAQRHKQPQEQQQEQSSKTQEAAPPAKRARVSNDGASTPVPSSPLQQAQTVSSEQEQIQEQEQAQEQEQQQEQEQEQHEQEPREQEPQEQEQVEQEQLEQEPQQDQEQEQEHEHEHEHEQEQEQEQVQPETQEQVQLPQQQQQPQTPPRPRQAKRPSACVNVPDDSLAECFVLNAANGTIVRPESAAIACRMSMRAPARIKELSLLDVLRFMLCQPQLFGLLLLFPQQSDEQLLRGALALDDLPDMQTAFPEISTARAVAKRALPFGLCRAIADNDSERRRDAALLLLCTVHALKRLSAQCDVAALLYAALSNLGARCYLAMSGPRVDTAKTLARLVAELRLPEPPVPGASVTEQVASVLRRPQFHMLDFFRASLPWMDGIAELAYASLESDASAAVRALSRDNYSVLLRIKAQSDDTPRVPMAARLLVVLMGRMSRRVGVPLELVDILSFCEVHLALWHSFAVHMDKCELCSKKPEYIERFKQLARRYKGRGTIPVCFGNANIDWHAFLAAAVAPASPPGH